MPPWSSLLVEAVAFGFFGTMVWQAWKAGPAKLTKLTTLLVAAAFGFAIELFFVTVYAGYSYGHFLVAFPVGGSLVPLWVAAGWGTIIYVSMEATERMGLTWYAAPPLSGLLALSLDVALDPIAVALDWWTWSRPSQFFDIPYDNFIGWVLIVTSYALGVRGGLELFKRHGIWKDIVVPIASLLLAVGAVAGSQLLLEKVFYPWLGEPHTFALLVIVLGLYLAPFMWKTKPTGTLPWFVWVVPGSYHLMFLVLLFTTGISSTTPELVMFLLVAPVASLFLFTHPR